MANIRISKKGKEGYTVTVDEYPEICLTGETYEEARDRAVELVKEEIRKNLPPVEAEEEAPRKVTIGFAA